MILPADHLRPPWPGEPAAAGYKDWLHVNIFDHVSGAVGLINVSLHGPPGEPAARAVGTALVDLPGVGWVGDVVVRGLDEAALGELSIATDQVAVGMRSRTGSVAASVRLRGGDVTCSLSGTAAGRPTVVELPVPFGSGWLGWYTIPQLRLTGSLRASGVVVDLAGASGYADHNWGRWHWGDDIGWEWGAFVAPAPAPVVVLSRLSDTAHREGGPPTLELRLGERIQRFPGTLVSVDWDPPSVTPTRRFPGATAALHSDRAASRQPGGLTIEAHSRRDHVQVRFDTRSVAQLALGDPMRQGYSFLHELTGQFRCEGTIAGERFASAGLAVIERVE